MASKDVEPRPQAALRPYQRFIEYVQERAQREQGVSLEKLTQDQMDKILGSAEVEDIWANLKFAGMIALKNLEQGTELRINGFHLMPGTREDYQNSLKVWAVLDAQRISDGIEMVLDTGIERIIAALRAFEAMGKFPVEAVVHKQQTGSGNDMVTLQPLPKRPVQGSAE